MCGESSSAEATPPNSFVTDGSAVAESGGEHQHAHIDALVHQDADERDVLDGELVSSESGAVVHGGGVDEP